MEIYFAKKLHHKIFYEHLRPKGYHPLILEDFVDTVEIIRSAMSIQDLRAIGCLHCEQLKPPFQPNDYSIQMSKKWRRVYFREEKNWTITIIQIKDFNKHSYGKK